MVWCTFFAKSLFSLSPLHHFPILHRVYVAIRQYNNPYLKEFWVLLTTYEDLRAHLLHCSLSDSLFMQLLGKKKMKIFLAYVKLIKYY